MADRGNHYEAALESWLRRQRVPYVAVDEARRACWSGGTLKSLDFIVSPEQGRGYLVDVKGRRFPGGEGRYWKCWSFEDDVESLGQWQRLFGPGFESLLVFAYWVTGSRSPVPPDRLFRHAGRRYAFLAVPLEEYRRQMRRISPRWQTVELPARVFRRVACELGRLLGGSTGSQPVPQGMSPVVPAQTESPAAEEVF